MCILAFLSTMVFAQQGNQPQEGRVRVYVWGEVKAPGTYYLATTPDLVELLSAAGGPTDRADVTHIRVLRAATGEELRVNFKRMMAKGQVFFLKTGDVVHVPVSFWGRGWSAFTEVLALTSGIASLISFYILLRGLR